MNNLNLTKTLQPKIANDFHVEFHRWDENSQNVLGAMVKTFQRPALTFEDLPLTNKRQRVHNPAKVEWQPITLQFNDDGMGVVSRALYHQAYRQANCVNQENMRFDIELKLFFNNRIVERYKLKNCWLIDITHDNNDVSNDQPNTISTTIVFDDVDYKLLDE